MYLKDVTPFIRIIFPKYHSLETSSHVVGQGSPRDLQKISVIVALDWLTEFEDTTLLMKPQYTSDKNLGELN